MNFFQLECFITLATLLNFTKAANAMFISQPTFSRHILSLEKELGVKLFHRDKRTVKLTKAGEVFQEIVQEVFTLYNNGVIRAKQAEKGEIGSLKIGFLIEKMDDFLPRLVQRFTDKYPNIGLIFYEYNRTGLEDALQDNRIDIAVTGSTEFSPNVEWEIVNEYCYGAVMHQDHPLANNRSIKISDLSEESFVLIDRQDIVIKQICREYGFNPNVVTKAQYFSGLLTLVDCKVGISILPSSLQSLLPPTVRFIRIDDINCTLKQVVAWKKDNLNPCLPHFLEEMRKFLLHNQSDRQDEVL